MGRRSFIKNSALLTAAGLTLNGNNFGNSSDKKIESELRKDLRSEPVKRMVVMGESNAYGMNALDPANEWVQIFAGLIRKFQDAPLRVFNNAIPANVISPDAPGYNANDINGTAPSAIERFEQDMISFKPDLAIYAYGLNDSRCGHTTKSFINAYRKILLKTRQSLPDALIVLVGPYWNVQYNSEAWRDPKYYRDYFGAFDKSGDELVLSYNSELPKLADEVNGIFIDVYSILEGAIWLLADDSCHFTDVGHTIIGQAVFMKVASYCSFLSAKCQRFENEVNINTLTTGGTNGLPNVIGRWRQNIDEWKQ
jgi:hypothetical protein